MTPYDFDELVGVFSEARRALHPSGCLWLNLGDSYANDAKWPNGMPGPGLDGAANQAAVRKPWRSDGVKKKDLLMIPSRVAMALQADGWYLRSACPWVKRNCLSGGTTLYARTASGDGPAMLKDLVRLDPATVQLWNGRAWTRVVEWHETPRPDAPLEIVLRNGERIGCTADHRWPTDRGLLHARDLQVGDVIDGGRLPEPAAPVTPELIPDDIGWFVGLYIAEGYINDDAIVIHGHVKEADRLARLRVLAERYGGSCVYRHRGGNTAAVTLHGPVLLGILQNYVSGAGAAGKHLHPRCWRRGDGFLQAVLDGYLSGDGGWDAVGRRWRLGFCSNDALAADIRTLGARLGLDVRLRRCKHKMGEKEFPGWRGIIRDPADARTGNAGTFKATDPRAIVSIGASRARKFWDVAVADDPHLFALASGTLTHNSMPESVTDRPGTSCEWVFLLAKRPSYFFDMEAVKRAGSPATAADKRIGTERAHDFDTAAANFGDVTAARTQARNAVGNADTRNLRTSDLWFDSVGMLLADTDEPDLLGFDVTPERYKGAHFAVMPTRLVAPMVLAGTSARGVCPHCGEPWTRAVAKERKATRPGTDSKVRSSGLTGGPYCPPGQAPHSNARKQDDATGRHDQVGFNARRKAEQVGNRDPERHVTTTRTVGWEQGCECPHAEPVPAVVGDMFTGSGTVAQVAVDLGRRFVGAELNPEYHRLIAKRLGKVTPSLLNC